MKICKICNEDKELEEFKKQVYRRKDGAFTESYSSKCMRCIYDERKALNIVNAKRGKKELKIINGQEVIEEHVCDINAVGEFLAYVSRFRGYIENVDIYRLISLYIDCYGLTQYASREANHPIDQHEQIVYMYNNLLKFYNERINEEILEK